MPKRRKTEDPNDAQASTPRKSRRIAKQDGNVASDSHSVGTPSSRKSILRHELRTDGEAEPTPKGLRRVLFSAETKATTQESVETPRAVRKDRSARRKSVRTLQSGIEEDGSEDDEAAQEAAIAKNVLGGDDEGSEAEDLEEDTEVPSAPTIPSKRGRPKGKRRERTPSPPPDLPPHELYFFHNRTGANKTSANTLPSNLLLDHEHYFTQINAYKDPHEADIRRLRELHKRAFDQWAFEVEEGFNICLYGYGSKRQLVMEFAGHIYAQAKKKPPNIVVVNGYTPGLTIRDMLTTLASVILPKTTKLPTQPSAIIDLFLSHLTSTPSLTPIYLIIHSLDHPNLRKASIQALLARLGSNPHINLTATCDTSNFALLWDTSLLRQFHWLYHDATTFEPYTAEVDVVEEVNALLGRSGRRLGGKDGIGYVLKSLPENARNLFRILVAEQLASADNHIAAATPADDSDDLLGASDEEAALQNTPSRRRSKKPKKAKPAPFKPAPVSAPSGVEYRTLYHKAVEGFVCSSELNFRTLLKEFHDHAMLESRKDALGTERLSVPLGREELEGVLEELV